MVQTKLKKMNRTTAVNPTRRSPQAVNPLRSGATNELSGRTSRAHRSWAMGGWNAMAIIDPKIAAAECDRVIERIADPGRRIVLESLRSLWIDLCDPVCVIDDPDRAIHIATITDLHRALMANCRTAMH